MMKFSGVFLSTCLGFVIAGCGGLGGGFNPDFDALGNDVPLDHVEEVAPDVPADVPVDVPADVPVDVPPECPDSDGDGVCDDDDVCPGGDDTIDSDGDTIPDYCDCEGLTCGAHAHCEDSGSGPECVCDDGYEGDGTTCTDVDECTAGTDACDANATCTNTDGGYDCDCNAGYSGDGLTCADVDECSLGTDTCHTNATCTNTEGGYTCACNTGYDGDGYSCTAIDHCARGTDTCHTNASCTYSGPGTYSCACNTGYSGDGFTCTPIDHCSAGTDTCHTYATCTYTGPGTYTCACISGYSGDGFSCTPINHCTAGTDTCHTYATCTYTGPGTYSCACNTGYSGDGFSCTPINHCTAGTDTCHRYATCTYTGPGTYSCACLSGYTGDGYTCNPTRGCYPYSASFTSGTAPTTQCTAWNTWRAGLPTSGLGHLAMFGSEDLVGRKCTDPTAVQALANALRTGTSGTWTCDGVSWTVGLCSGAVGIGAGSGDCACADPGWIARPCIGNVNWGGMGTDTCPGTPSQEYNVVFCGGTDFCSCVGSWCPQEGTLGQYTRCSSASAGCTTCANPEIRYGTTTGGVPVTHTGNRYDTWCQQLGFSDYATSSVVLGTRSCTSPNGTVFGCTSYDETTWHWCDYSDGYWFDASLDYHLACTGSSITSITCVP